MLEKLNRGHQIIHFRLTHHGLWPTILWAADHAVRRVTGAPIRAVSQILPGLHVGGQYRRRGWKRLAQRGITAVVNMRVEFDDQEAGIAPPRYLHLPTIDDHAPTLAHLNQGVAFIARELEAGGGVYVHCGAGVGRAATMAAAYLVSTGMSTDAAWARIRAARPFIRPMPPQVEQLDRFAASADSSRS